MTTRAVIVLVLVASSLAAGVSFVLAANALHEGPAGPQGEVGPPGPPGEAAETEVSSNDVVRAIEEDADAVAQAISGQLDYEDIRQNLDPDPADVARDVRELRRQLDDLCSELSLAEAVSADISAC